MHISCEYYDGGAIETWKYMSWAPGIIEILHRFKAIFSQELNRVHEARYLTLMLLWELELLDSLLGIPTLQHIACINNSIRPKTPDYV